MIAFGSPVFRFRLAPCAAGAFALLASAGVATAQNRPASNDCAIYGSGFVAIQGTGSCVRIGGRVRLEAATRFGGGRNAGGALGFAGGAQNDGPTRAHMRLEGPLGGRR